MRTKRRIGFAAMAAAIAFAILGAIATLAIPVDTPERGNGAAKVNVNAQVLPPLVGTFTGDYVDGVPVYRLPPLAVSANRKAELARIEREERLAQAKQGNAAGETPGPAQPAGDRVVAAVGGGK